MVEKSIVFQSEASASGDFEKPWAIRSGRQEGMCAIPAEFKGGGGGWSPEDLYLQSLINCFIGTFKVYARASRIIFKDLNVHGRLFVEKDESGKTMMKRCRLRIAIAGVERFDRVETLIAKVFKDGFILNSVKTEIGYELHVEGLSNESVV